MPVLIIVLSAYLFFFAVIALIAIAEYADRRERRRQAAARATLCPVSLAGMMCAQAADPLFVAFWKAQVPVLRAISDAGHGGARAAALRCCFAGVCGRFPEIYEGHGLQDWLQFLEQEELLFCQGDKVKLTPQGAEFLRLQLTRDATVNR